MTQSVAHDFLLVLTITGLGMGIGLSFDCYRLLRRKFRPNYLSTQLSDLLFWLICVGPTFYAFYWIIEGSVRFFTILFLPVGMFLYLKFASPPCFASNTSFFLYKYFTLSLRILNNLPKYESYPAVGIAYRYIRH